MVEDGLCGEAYVPAMRRKAGCFCGIVLKVGSTSGTMIAKYYKGTREDQRSREVSFSCCMRHNCVKGVLSPLTRWQSTF